MKLKYLSFIVSSWFVITMCPRTLAVTYYVSPSGDDGNPGTSTQRAWRTLDKVNALDLNPGDRVLLEAGHDYPGNLLLTAEDAGTPVQPVVIGSYSSGRAMIKAGDGSGVTVQNAGGVEVKDLIVTGDDYKTNVGSGVKIVNELPNNQKLEYIRIHNVEASGFGYRGIFVGEWTEDESKSGYKDVRITHCVTHQNRREGILIIGCPPDDPDTLANSNVYVGHSKMYDNPGDPENLESHSGSGILMAEVDGGVIEYCEAYNNGYDTGCRRGGPIGIWTWRVNNIIIQHCESHHNRALAGDGGGFDFDGGTTNSIMQYNYSHDNDGTGFMICSIPYENTPHSYSNNTVRYNITVNDGQKNNYWGINLWTGSAKDAPIYNTQIYGNTVYSSTSSAIAFCVKEGIYNTKVFNNLFVTSNNQKLVQGNPDRSMATFAGNAYWAVDGKYDIAGHKSLEAWRKATGQEMLNGNPIGLAVDPKLIDMGKSVTIGDPTKHHTLTAYRLQKNSPLIDAGLDLRSLFGIDPGDRDFFGTSIPQGKAYDIGAHEIVLENTPTVKRK
ncbi:MAG: right-handed parallel beta-helix repeat-containing protein [Phycisphaerales bacterium]|nr:MAG: right-handed parallel beta-helix repeat-containing protein [Phycisphaerales bacterium]